MKLFTAFMVPIVFCSLLNACANTTAVNAAKIANDDAVETGNPYRWETKSVEGGALMNRTLIGSPGATAADAMVMRDVLVAIEKSGGTGSTDYPTQPKEVRIVSQTDTNSTEIWVFDDKDKSMVYVVKLQMSGSGGTNIEITGPW